MFKKFFFIIVFFIGIGAFVFAQGATKSASKEPAKTVSAPVDPPVAVATVPANTSTNVVASQAPVPVMEMDMSQAGLVTLDFRDADIKNVLKVISYKSGVNIITGPEVVGLVNIQLRDVQWQKALDVILANYGYSYEQKGAVIMVTTVDNLKKRREDAQLLAQQEPVATETFILNFGKAEDVLKSLDKMRSARGSINYDKRTNAIIVSDVESNLALFREVVKKLDSVTPQVLIEAKIIETTLNKSENMGVDWTLQAGVSGSSRETTFPFTVKGSEHKYLPLANADTETSAGVSTSPTTITYGTLDFTSLQVVMEMLKTRADTNIISSPRIVTLDNQPAKIVVGSQYPVPQYIYNQENNALQVSGWNYLDIGVQFNVTPHVNNAQFVTVDIEPTVTDILGYVTVQSTQMPQLSTETAKTSVMIRDGETLVIAGLIKDKKVDTRKKVPILGDIPILGWPFQKKEYSSVKSEMLIFLTPHIITPSMPLANGQGNGGNGQGNGGNGQAAK
jgi:type IV pilus assembly protein PilQ